MDDGPDLPRRNLTLKQYCDLCAALHDDEETIADFVRLNVCGIHAGQQICVDPIQNRMSQDEGFTIERDYDSFLGFGNDICVVWDTPVAIHVVSNNRDVLMKDIKIEHQFSFGNLSIAAPPHHVPNISIGTFGVRGHIRAFFPGLYSENRSSPVLTTEEQRVFYESGLRPALASLLDNKGTDLPPKYSNELWRAKGHGQGGFGFQSRLLEGFLSWFLGDLIRENLKRADVPWHDGIIFLHQVRGVKSTTSHGFEDELTAEYALDKCLKSAGIDPERIEPTHSYVDVGIEVSSRHGRCLAWRLDSHHRFLQELLGLDDRAAHRLTALGSSKYNRDLTSLLTDIAGCRIHDVFGPFLVEYLQLYQTDKGLTYRIDGFHTGKFVTAHDLLTTDQTPYLRGLYDAYINAIETCTSNARAEVRVPYAEATKVFVGFDENIFPHYLISVSRSVWWSLRAYRALAFKYVIDWQRSPPSTPEHRSKRSALLLTAAMSWFLNALHSTPDIQSASRDLLKLVLPHVNARDVEFRHTLPYPMALPRQEDDDDDSEGDSDNEEFIALNTGTESDSEDDRPRNDRPRKARRITVDTVPCVTTGMYFTRRGRFGQGFPCPRLDHSRFDLAPRSYIFFFKQEYAALLNSVFRLGTGVPSHPNRISNKRRRTLPWVDQGQGLEADKFNLEEKGHDLPEPAQDAGSDMEVEDEFRPPPAHPDDAILGLNDQATNCWRQGLLDVTAKCSNRKGFDKESYCGLDVAQRGNVNMVTYQNLVLSDYFTDCQYALRRDAPALWDLTFDNMFPPKDRVVKIDSQGYSKCEYWGMYMRLRSGPDETVKALRKALKEKFDQLEWFPWLQADKMWKTGGKKVDPRFRRCEGNDQPASTPAPYVLIRTNTQPTW